MPDKAKLRNKAPETSVGLDVMVCAVGVGVYHSVMMRADCCGGQEATRGKDIHAGPKAEPSRACRLIL